MRNSITVNTQSNIFQLGKHFHFLLNVFVLCVWLFGLHVEIYVLIHVHIYVCARSMCLVSRSVWNPLGVEL